MGLRGVCCILVVSACGCGLGRDAPDAGSNLAPGECRVARDCGAWGRACVWSPDAGRGSCIRVICLSDAECAAPQVCNLHFGMCEPPQCDPNAPSQCAPGTRCVNRVVDGNVVSGCEATVSAPPLTGCLADVDVVTLTPGAQHALTFFGVLADSRLVPALPFSLLSKSPAVATVDDRGDVLALAEGHTLVTATAGGASCAVAVHVVPAADEDAVHVVVEDEDTGRPLAGTPAQLRQRNGSRLHATTDAHGFARFTGIADPGDVTDVTVAPRGHGWMTYASVRARDLLFRVPAVAKGAAHGQSSRVDIPPASYREGLQLVSITGALDQVSLSTLAGPPLETEVNIDGFVDQQVVPWPASATVALDSDAVKDVAFTAVDGACGGLEQCPRAVATFGFRAATNDLGVLLFVNTEIPGAFLWERVPLFRRGMHAVDLRLLDRIRVDGGMPAASTTTQVIFPARQGALWQVPRLPALDGEFPPHLMQLLVLVGVLVPRMGFVPLGFDAVADACVPRDDAWTCPLSREQDGIIACAASRKQPLRCSELAPGQIRVSYAYPHDGLETFPLLAMLLASHPGNEDRPLRPTSLLLSHAPSWSATVPGELAAREFPAIPDGHWMPPARSYTVTRVPAGADILQLRIHDGVRPWSLYAPVQGVPAVVEIPPAPPGADGFIPLEVNLSTWQLASGALDEMTSIAGGGLRDLVSRAAAVSRRR